MSATRRHAAEEAVFGRRGGASSWAVALTLQVGAVLALAVVAKVRGPTHARRLTETMVEFVAPPPRPHDTPPPPPPPPPPPAARPRPVARPAPRAPTPVAPPPPTVSEAPPVMTAPGHGAGERVATGNNSDFHGGAVAQGAQGNAPEAPPAPPAPPAPAVQRGPIQLPESGDPPEPASANATPEYPPEARAQGVEATVIATLVINEEGRVLRVIIRRGHPLFDEVVRTTLLTWRYQPARVAGEAVEVYWNVRVPFRLEER